MRICIIGPSHLAALRKAEQNGLVDTRGHQITYMGHVWWVFENLRVDDACLFFDMMPPVRPVAADLPADVTVTDYDALVVHGVMKPASRMSGWVGDRHPALSESMRGKLVGRALKRGGAFAWLSEIRDVFQGPIIVSSQPEKAVPPGETVDGNGSAGLVAVNQLLDQALAERGFIYLPQPAETVLDGRFTLRQYSEGSVKLKSGGEHDKEDVLHMNEKYGALVLEQAIVLVEETMQQSNRTARRRSVGR